MLLFNTRASGFNVKQYKSAYFTSAAYPNESLPGRQDTWLTVSGFDSSNVPNFGRKAQRGVVVAALKSSIDSSTALREDQNVFNLIACPGYPELMPNMVVLNEDRDNTAFIIGDTPMRLPATGTAIQAWADNTDGATSTGENGIITSALMLVFTIRAVKQTICLAMRLQYLRAMQYFALLSRATTSVILG
jgi:hypothetical protein